MTPSKTVQAACDTLIQRVRYSSASLNLAGSTSQTDDTAAIREATRLYTDTWIIPLLRAIKENDLDTLRLFTR